MKRRPYTPLRSLTVPTKQRYSAQPLPWWNRLRLTTGTRTRP